jgi:hypothetical protein
MRLRASVVAVMLLLAGCGGGSTPHTASRGPVNGVADRAPGQIVAAAVRTIDSARSVHVVGSIADNGIQVRLDLHLARGRGGEGEVSENGLGFQLISAGKVLYIQGSRAFWIHFGGANAAKLFHGRWLKAPDSGQFATLGKLATTQGLVGQLLSKHGNLSRGGQVTVDGQPAVGVIDRTQGGTLFVAATGRPYPLEIIRRGSDGGYVKFTDFNGPVTITPPRKSISLPSPG